MNYGYIIAILVIAAGSGGLHAQVSENSRVTGPIQNDKIIESFEVYDADIRSVFKQLSAYSGVDIVASDDVKGRVSLSVSRKSWRDVLGIICKVHHLAASNEGSYIYVLTNESYQKRQVTDATSFQVAQDLAPLRREVIKINHVPAKEIKESIESLLSARGKITVVEHTNAMIIYDTDDNIKQMRNMVSELDMESAQISISCKIIEVSSGALQRLGIHWGYFDQRNNVSAAHIPQQTGFIADALERVTYGILSPEKFSATLEYLFTDNKGEVVAQPQITTLDNKEARIFMGQQVPITYLDEAGNTVVKMINAGTALVVKPHISGEGRILMELNPKKESYTLQGSTPIINEQSANTNVVVSNGETVVIAGLTSNETSKVESGIPVLKNIPLLGNLFKKSEKRVEKRDLIIFVTPHIIQRGTDGIPRNKQSEQVITEETTQK